MPCGPGAGPDTLNTLPFNSAALVCHVPVYLGVCLPVPSCASINSLLLSITLVNFNLPGLKLRT